LNQTAPFCLRTILALVGSLTVVVLSTWINTNVVTRHVDSSIGALRAEMKQGFAELRLEIERRGLVRP
jgi:hypothetical protein